MTSMGRIATATDRSGAPSGLLDAVPAPPEAHALVRPAATALDSLAGEWDALAERASEPNPFAERWFVAASLATLADPSEIRILEVRRGRRLIGVLPVAIETGYARLPVAFVQNWSHHHMFLGTPLVEAGAEKPFWAAVLAALDDAPWARELLHVRGLVENGPIHLGLAAATREAGRAPAIVHRRIRAFLASHLAPQAYFEQAVRAKKRKELRRLRNRLAEMGPVRTRALDDDSDLAGWCDSYLAMEEAGWKGEAGTALAHDRRTERFFRDVVAAAKAAGRLQFLRLEVGGRPIAMLVNFLTPPGSFSFKTVFDEAYARFSPGVLIQLDNLAILDRSDIAWMDSCAVDDHPMIESLWTERRSVVRITVRLKGARRGAVFALCRALERGAAALRGRRL